MLNKFWQEAQQIKEEIVSLRRDFHKYAEPAWTEYRTAGIAVKYLQTLGFEVFYGNDALTPEDMVGLPTADILRASEERALREGADKDLLEKMRGGKTAVVAVMRFDKPGATVGLRFDMDANNISETDAAQHFPNREHFSSIHEGAMHACGHDAHTAMGLIIAKLIAKHQNELSGTIKLFFQPAEEGICGARAMVAKGIADDVDWFIGMHIGATARQGEFVAMANHFMATSKFDALFTGTASHAGGAPEKGRSAVLAAAQATVALHAIPRHSKGSSRVNVGVFHGGSARNIIAQQALLQLETRGETTDIDAFMAEEALRILRGTAAAYGVEVKITAMGSAPSYEPDHDMAQEAASIVKEHCQFEQVTYTAPLGGSEDCTYFMQRVQQKGGHAIYALLGTNLAAGHHNGCFDIDENDLPKGVAVLTILAAHFLGRIPCGK